MDILNTLSLKSNRQIKINFNGGDLSSDAGLLLRGAHIWIFFDNPVSAALVRKFGIALLDKGAEQVNLKSFKYYDRMLPAQDTLPEGGVGNLIALPLQGKALRDGNSAFIDRSGGNAKNLYLKWHRSACGTFTFEHQTMVHPAGSI